MLVISEQSILSALKPIKFGPLQKDRLSVLVTMLNHREDLSIPEKAYILATAWHESDQFKATKEYLSDEGAERNYGVNSRKGSSLGNVKPGDGAKYKGRGFVQLTGRYNYRRAYAMIKDLFRTNPSLEKEFTEEELNNINKFTFEQNPDLVSNYRTASLILIEGMKRGLFTGKALNRYINVNNKDYRQARRTVNGLDKAILISSYATKLEKLFHE